MEQKVVLGKYTEEIDYLENEIPKREDNIKLDLNEIGYDCELNSFRSADIIYLSYSFNDTFCTESI
jgi:cytochrome c556